MGFKSKNIFLISFLAIAGIFGVSSAVINKQVNETPVVEEAKAATTYTQGTRVYIQDESGANWCNSSIKVVAHLYSIKAVNDSGYSGVGDLIGNDIYGTIKGTDGSSYIDITMNWNGYGYECILPWYIASFSVEFYAPSGGNNRHLYWNGGSNKVKQDCAVNSNVETYVKTVHGWDSSANAYVSTSNGGSGSYSWQFHGIKSGSHMYISVHDLPGWVDTDSCKLGVYFWRSNISKNGAWGCKYTNEERENAELTPSVCWRVEGQSDDYLYECIVPQYEGQDVWFSMVRGVRLSSATTIPTFDNRINETGDQYYNSTDTDCNMLWVNAATGGSWTGGGYLRNDKTISDSQRAEFYGAYFNYCIECDGKGSFSGTWSDVQGEYNQHLSDSVQYIVFNAAEDPTEATELGFAMPKYDYICQKYGIDSHDFIGRGSGEEISDGWVNHFATRFGFNFLVGLEDNTPTIIIVVASSVVLLSVTMLSILVLKKRKNKEQE